MPPELLAVLGIELPLLRRDPHYFLPTTGERYLLFGRDREETRRQFSSFFSEADWNADQALQAELAMLREDLAPAWMQEPLPVEETAERFVRSTLRKMFVDLCRGSVGEYLDRFAFRSDLIKAMYAVTDGLTGLTGTWDTPGSGMNFLIHNMCRLPGSDGTWMIVQGGMGTVTGLLAEAAAAAGARIETGCAVRHIETEAEAVTRVVLADDSEIRTRAVVCNADPFRMRDLVGREHLPVGYNQRLDGYVRDGTSLKVNLCLSALPKFRCLPELPASFAPTIHLLPEEHEVLDVLRQSFEDARAGRLPAFPAIEWYIHTGLDPSLRDEAGHHNAALFVQWVPYALSESSWDAEEERYVRHLLSICDRFAPGTSELVVDTFVLTPERIEKHFGITRGHIQHVDNSFGFADRLPYATPLAGLYSCSAGCHPGGSVNGCAGYNAAMRLLKDMQIAPER